jgi:hypothetical protein
MKTTDSILCFYHNPTGKLQLARLLCQSSFERLVFPGEKFMFEALPEGTLEIYTYTKSGISLLENVVCQDLQVHQKDAGKR